MARYFALNELDVKIEKYLGFRNGVFFEAGANDGENQSNTCYFAREKGWTGVLVEPIVKRFDHCKQVRTESNVFWAALVPPDWDKPYVELTYCDLMTVTKSDLTRTNQEIHVDQGRKFLANDEHTHQFYAPARTISSILSEARVDRIDLFSLDLEGFEGAALRGVDFESVDIRHLVVECWNLDEITSVLGSRYEILDKLSHHDYLFRKVQSGQVR